MTSDRPSQVPGFEVTKKTEENEPYYLTGSVQDIISRLASPVVASVEFPSNDQLKVRLVNVDFLDKMDELNSDIAQYQGVFFTIVGVVLGLTSSAFPTGPLTPVNIYSLIAICFGLMALSFLWVRLKKLSDRRAKLKDKLLLRK